MAVDIQQARAVRLLVYDMVVPDLVIERESQGFPREAPNDVSGGLSIVAAAPASR
jgi:hypothetical protein